MAMTKCAECGHDISTKADKCPSCGAPQVTEAVQRAKQDPLGLHQPVGKGIWIALGLGVAFILFVVLAGKSADSTAKKEVPTDLTKSLVTRDHAIVCPIALLFDKRADGGLKAANEALGTGIGRSEAVQKAGCEEWRAGMSIYVQPSEIHARDGYVHWMEAHQLSDFSDQPILIPDSDVVNPVSLATPTVLTTPSPIATEPTAYSAARIYAANVLKRAMGQKGA